MALNTQPYVLRFLSQLSSKRSALPNKICSFTAASAITRLPTRWPANNARFSTSTTTGNHSTFKLPSLTESIEDAENASATAKTVRNKGKLTRATTVREAAVMSAQREMAAARHAKGATTLTSDKSGATAAEDVEGEAQRVKAATGKETRADVSSADEKPTHLRTAPRMSRLLLPPTLPKSMRESGEGNSAVAAAMDKLLEERATGRQKAGLGRRMSGNDYMRMVVPRERKNKTKHTGGQNVIY